MHALRGSRAGRSGLCLALRHPAICHTPPLNMEQQQLQELVDKAHIVCPYSNATRNNIDVRLQVTT